MLDALFEEGHGKKIDLAFVGHYPIQQESI